MPTSETVITIYNGALDMIAEVPATSIAEDKATVRWLNRNYARVVQSTLRRDVWNFATETHELTEAAAPASRWTYAYNLPNGWLRVLPPTYNGLRTGTPIIHEVKGNQVVTDHVAPLYAELVMDTQSPGDWDPLFADVIIARLAQGMAHRFTHKASFIDRTTAALQDAYDVAATINAFEGSPQPNDQHDVIRVRGY